MSDDETRVGKLKKTDLTVKEVVDKYLAEHEEELPSIEKYYTFPDSYEDFFRCELSSEYVLQNDTVYEVIEENAIPDYGDIYEASENSDGTINYVLRYYNGGCGFEEAIITALDRMKEK
jgi:hypothetical protein